MADSKEYGHGATVDGAAPANPPPANPPPYTPTPPGVYPHPPPPGSYETYGTTIQTTVVSGSVPVILTRQMGPNPMRVTCRSCNFEIITRVETKATMRTHLFAVLLCLLFCWPCVCVPYCMDSCMNTDHYCPNCNAYVGSYLT